MGRDFDFLEAARVGDVLYFEKFYVNKKIRPLTSLRRGPNANTQDSNGYSALHHSALNGFLEIVKILLVHDANPNLLDGRGSSALHLAAWAGHQNICRLLLASPNTVIGSANVNALTSQREAPLHFAAQFGHVKVVATLLEYDADPDILTLYGETPLDLAAKFGRMDVVQLMVYAFPDSAPFGNVTPLHLAARNGHQGVCEFLLDTGYVSVNATAPDGSTPLHEAIISGHLGICRHLIAHGANCHVRNANGETIADLLDQFPDYVIDEFREILKNGTNPLYYSKSEYDDDRYITEPTSAKRGLIENNQHQDNSRLMSIPPKKPPRSRAPMSKSMDETMIFASSENHHLTNHLDHNWHIRLAHDYTDKTSGDFFLVSYNKNRRLRRLQFGNYERSTVIKNEDTPTSPTYYDQPPTPTHPPPAPALAERKIFEKLRPLSAEYYLGFAVNCAPFIQWEFFFEVDTVKKRSPTAEERRLNEKVEIVLTEEWLAENRRQVQALMDEVQRELYPEATVSPEDSLRQWATSQSIDKDLMEKVIQLGFDNLQFLNEICTKEVLAEAGISSSKELDKLLESIKVLPKLQEDAILELTKDIDEQGFRNWIKKLALGQYYESVKLFFSCGYWRHKLNQMTERESGLWLGIETPGHLRRLRMAMKVAEFKETTESKHQSIDQVLTVTGQELSLPDDLSRISDSKEVEVQVMFKGYLATLTISTHRIDISKTGTNIIEHRHNLRNLIFICQDGEDLTKFGYSMSDASFWEFQTSSIFTAAQIMVIIAQRFSASSNNQGNSDNEENQS